VALEVNFDGLVGPTHNYAGLSRGNVASQSNAQAASEPRSAALQGLAKMKAVRDLGLTQAVLPPQPRPDVGLLRSLGFAGDDAEILRRAADEAPTLLAAAGSASCMWTANAATVSPSADTTDGRVHFTPANLESNLHRAIEAPTTQRILAAIFADDTRFAVHPPLPSYDALGDEGAANHTRFCDDYGRPGVALFVYGRSATDRTRPMPTRYPARQTLEASQVIARSHGLAKDGVVFAQQSPDAIDAGVFHNDVVSVGNQTLFLVHAGAFIDQRAVLDELRAKVRSQSGAELTIVELDEDALPMADAVRSYLFNSQLVRVGDGMSLVAPSECMEIAAAKRCLDGIVAGDNPVQAVHPMDVRQSMRNGGGPACLRLRVALTDDELTDVNPACILDDALHDTLKAWIERTHREAIEPSDLADPALLEESRRGLDELTQILQLGSVYDFQR